jgi:hypothetical protein
MYLVKWAGGKEGDKSWIKEDELPQGMVASFDKTIYQKRVITHVVAAAAKGRYVVMTSHNTRVEVGASDVPAAVLSAFTKQKAATKKASNREHHCRTGWCSRRGPAECFVSVPEVYTGANQALKVSKDKHRLEFYRRMGRGDLVDGTTPTPKPGTRWRVCKSHFFEKCGRQEAPKWLPLRDDPVFNRKIGGIRLAAVAGSSVFATAREEATARHGTDYSEGAALTEGVGAGVERESRRYNRAVMSAGLLSPQQGGGGGGGVAAKVSPGAPSAAQVQRISDSLQSNLDLKREIAALRAELESLRKTADMHASKPVFASVSFESLTAGEMQGSCKQFAVLSAKGAMAMVEAAEVLGCKELWEEVIADECTKASLSKTKALTFGFANAAMLVCAKCKLADSFAVLGWMFGLGSGQQGITGLIFKVTLQILNSMLRRTVARVPDVTQVDKDTLPDFKHPMFAEVGATVDASNADTQTSHNPNGDKHSHSKYYGGNCGKYSVAISNDGLPMWISFVFGGRGSESGIMQASNFEEWYREFMRSCVDEDGEPFDPKVMADKGTKIGDMCQRLGVGYITPSQLVDRDLTAQDLQENELIAKARGHVERAIGKAKRFRILSTPMHHRLLPMIDDILYFCFFASHFCDA